MRALNGITMPENPAIDKWVSGSTRVHVDRPTLVVPRRPFRSGLAVTSLDPAPIYVGDDHQQGLLVPPTGLHDQITGDVWARAGWSPDLLGIGGFETGTIDEARLVADYGAYGGIINGPAPDLVLAIVTGATGQVHNGGRSLQGTSTPSGTPGVVDDISLGFLHCPFLVEWDSLFRLRCWVRHTHATNFTVRLGLEDLDGYTGRAAVVSKVFTTATNTWKAVELTGRWDALSLEIIGGTQFLTAPPAVGVRCRPFLSIGYDGYPPAGAQWWIDDLTLELGSANVAFAERVRDQYA